MSTGDLVLKVTHTIHRRHTSGPAWTSQLFSPVAAVLAEVSPGTTAFNTDILAFQIVDAEKGTVGASIVGTGIVTWQSPHHLCTFGLEDLPIRAVWEDPAEAAAEVRSDLGLT
jgi:hypothetical protein